MRALILFCLLVVPSITRAQNYFVDGMIWKVMVFGTQYQEYSPTLVVTSIDGDTIVDGQQALKMYQSWGDGATELAAIVRTEGDKVFFHDASSATGWSLCYDFGLEIGEGCYVKGLTSPCITTYIKCVDIHDSPEYGGWSVMELEEYEDESCSTCYGTGVWLRGLCSSKGVTSNNRLDVDGMGAYIVSEVYCGKQLLYQNTANGISGTTVGRFSVSVDGLSVKVSGVEGNESLLLFSGDGRMLRQIHSHTGELQIRLPQKGVYILKAGRRVSKISAF